MNIEKERLRLIPHETSATEEGGVVLRLANGDEVDLPTQFLGFYRHTVEGASLSQMARGLRAVQSEGRFAALARYLIFLGENSLLADRAAQRLAESLRSDFRWPESIAAEPLIDFEIFRSKKGSIGGPNGAAVAMVAALTVLAVGGFCFFNLLKSPMNSFASLESDDGVVWVVSLILVFSLGRSVRSLLQFVVLRLGAGYEASLRLQIAPTSVALATDDLSRARGTEGLLIGGVGTLLATSAPVWILSGTPWAPLASFCTWLLLLSEFSPFVRSPLTEWLRAFYNTFDRGSGRSSTDESLESAIKSVHISACVVWSVGLALFLVGPWFESLSVLKGSVDLSNTRGQVSIGLLVLFQGIVLFSFISDILGAVRYGGGNETRGIRRLWKRRKSSQAVDEAIRSGRVPSKAELEALPVLRQLDAEARAEMIARAKIVELDEGEAACRQGKTDRSLFILLSGRLAVAKSSASKSRRVVAWLDAGSVFGEAAFFLGQTRTADVVAVEPSVVLEIRHEPGMMSLEREKSAELQLRIWFLQALVSGSLFKELPSEALDALVFAGRKKMVPAGQDIVREGQDGDACYFIVQGQATVMQNGRVINRMAAGEAFGEIALMRPMTPRTATVIADGDILAVMIDAEKFWDLLSSHLPLALEIERLAERRLRQDRERMSHA